MAHTTYIVTAFDAAGAHDDFAHRANKPAAIRLADERRAETGEAVQVRTNAGTVVYEVAAVKHRVIKTRTPKYTRVETNLPELGEVAVPDGYDVAYARTRGKLLVLRKRGVKGDYQVLDVTTGEAHPAANTKETAALMKQIRRERVTA